MPSFLSRRVRERDSDGHPIPPIPFRPHQRAARPERLPRGPRRIRDGLWSPAHHAVDDDANTLTSMTHADGHSIVWPSRSPRHAALVDPDGYVIDSPAASREAFAFAFHWGQP